MTIIEGIIMGLLQGLTEFLPISSSAHLTLCKWLLGRESAENYVLFDLICHLGTLLTVFYFFRKEIVLLLTQDRKRLALVFLATLPLIPCYFLLKPLREFASAPQYLGICLMISSLILFLGSQWKIERKEERSWQRQVADVLMIGTLQSAALIPGISRSGSTISCAQVLGWSPQQAVRFSFLLSIPTIVGGNCWEALKIYSSPSPLLEVPISACIAAFLASCSMGLVAIRFAIGLLEKGNLKPFAWYCLTLGFVTTILFSRV